MNLNGGLSGHLSLKQELKILAMPKQQRQRFLRKFVMRGRKYTRQRIRQQKGLDGQPLAPKKNGRKGKVLKGMGKGLVAYADSDKGVLKYKNARTGKIGYMHQMGIGSSMTASQNRKRNGEPDYKGPATKKQAKALIEEGFKGRKEGGKGYKRVSQKWIVANLTLGQAGVILRHMTDQDYKDRWDIPLEARPYFGITDKEINIIVKEIMTDVQQTLATKKR